MQDINKIAEELFNKIRARFDKVSLGDEKAKSTTKPEEARFINFDYVSADGQNFGNITLSIVDEKSLKVLYNTHITQGLDSAQQDEWTNFLRSLRKFARRNMLQIAITDITKSNLDLRDIKQQSNDDGKLTNKDVAISEASLYGLGNNKRMSFADVGPHKLIIKHKDQINPEIHGARARQIEHIFIETPIGERFLLDHTNLHGAKAIANHLRHGGRMGDEGSDLINEMVKEMASMRHFVRSMRNRTFEDAETTGMVESAIYRYNEVRNQLKQFQGRKGHELLTNMLQDNQGIQEEEVDIDALRERFVKKIYDDRFNEALPYVYKAYKNKQKTDSVGTKEFESWANTITDESLNDNTVDDVDIGDFSELIKTPINTGLDGRDAVNAISEIHFLDDEKLFRIIQNLANSQGPDVDARPIIAGWLAKNGMSDLANQIATVLKQQSVSTTPAPVSAPPRPQPTGATTMDEPVVSEDIEMIRYLSGLVKK